MGLMDNNIFWWARHCALSESGVTFFRVSLHYGLFVPSILRLRSTQIIRVVVCVSIFIYVAVVLLGLRAPLQVDPAAFAALTECIAEADFEKCDSVPSGDDDGYLINPLGGMAVDMAGPSR